MIAADRFEYSCSCTKIIRTARARTSVEYLFALLLFSIGSIHTYFGASGKLGAVQFGEQFNLTNDDEDLTSVLKAHLQLLGKDRNELAQTEPVFDADGKTRIVDLMLSQRLPTSTDEERKHLVIELKRPSHPLNEDVINQIKKYAKAVALDDRFKNSSVEWDFLAVSNNFTRDAELEAKQTGKPRGLVLEIDEPKIRVWAKTWGQIIDESQGRLTFFKRGLEYEANDVHALEYLKGISDEYLSDEVRQKISEMAAQ